MIVFIIWISLASSLLESHPGTYVLVALGILLVRILILFFLNRNPSRKDSGKSPPLSCTVRFERRIGVPNPLQRIQAIPMTTKTLQEIENNGSEAYWAKQDRDANPHTEGTPESNSWYSGWDQADEENDDDDPTRLCYECDQPIEECQCEDRRR